MSKLDMENPMTQDFEEMHPVGQQFDGHSAQLHSGYNLPLHQAAPQMNHQLSGQTQNQVFSFAHLQNANNYNQPHNLSKNVATSQMNTQRMYAKLMNGSLTTKRSLNDYINNRSDQIVQKHQTGGVQLASASSFQAQKDMLVKLAPAVNTSEQQYEIYKKNFPYMNDQEIREQVKQDMSEEEVSSSQNANSGEKSYQASQLKQFERITNINKNLTQLKRKRLMQPHFASQSQQFAQRFQNVKIQNQAKLNNVPKASKKRGRQAFDYQEESQHQTMVDESVDVAPQADKIEEDSQEPDSQTTQINQIPYQQVDQSIGLQQIEIEVGADQDQQINSCNNAPVQHQQVQHPNDMATSLQDKFFNEISDNLNNYLHDKGEAYKFITNLLTRYDQSKAAEVEESANSEMAKQNEHLQKKLTQITKESKVLKNGIKIQNRKIGENEQKCKYYDQLFSENQKMATENTTLKTTLHYILKQQIGDPHMQMNLRPSTGFGGSGSFGGGPGIC